MEDLKRLIADNIVKYRKMAKLTQGQLAEKLNYSDKSVSKWERGDSIPDVIVLKQMAFLFGISLDTLTSNQVEKPKLFRRFLTKVYTDKFLISSIATLVVWLVATICFVCLSLFASLDKVWLCFIYAITANFIVLICLTKFWKSAYYNFITVSALMLSLTLALSLTLNIKDYWLLFIICIPLIALAFLWFIARKKIFKRFK